MSKMDYEAPVTFVRDFPTGTDLPPSQEMTLADAVFTALAEHRCGETPAITGCPVELYGIDAIRAVRNLPDFPKS